MKLLNIQKAKEFIKKRKKLTIILSIVFLLLLLIIRGAIAGKNKGPQLEFIDVEKGNVVQEVDVTGKVKPAEAIDFAFETSGKVASVKVKVGDKVKAGQTLATLKNSDVGASISQARAGVDSSQAMVAQYQAMLDTQKIKLEELKKGSRPEEIAMAQLKLDNAKQSYENTLAKINTDTNQLLTDSANSANGAVNAGLSSLNVITDIQYAHFNGNDQDALVLAAAKEYAVEALVGGRSGGRWIFQFINNMKEGARGSALSAQNNPTKENVSKALNDVNIALIKISQTLDAIPFNTSVLSSSEKTNIVSERANINTQISLISSKIESLNSLDSTNNSLISNAQNSISLAEQELNLKKAGATVEQIRIQETAIDQAKANLNSARAQVRSAQASLASASAMYSKTVLISTIAGTVTKVDVKAGEIASSMSPAVSVMSDAKLNIEAFIPEADIAKVKLDNLASVTLDAYGLDVVFDSKVVKIDPAETVIEGVSTYKVTIEFLNEDEKIKSGLTANITISTAKAEEVLIVPQRSLIRNDGKVQVLVSEDGKTTREVEVETGLYGSDGNVEIVSGLSEGDRIVNPSSVKK